HGYISVMPNNGDGTFGARVDYQPVVDGGPIAIAAADLDFDHKPDVVLVDNFVSAVTVFLGKDRGTPWPSTTYYVTGNDPVALAIAQLNANQDTARDIVVVNAKDSTVSVLLNDEHGGFPIDKSKVKTYPTGHSPQSVVAVDVDGDGLVDLVVANHGDSSLA